MSTLYDEYTFYQQFSKDLINCKKEVIIESPFITSKRMKSLWAILNRLINSNIKIYIVTRNPKEHSKKYAIQSELEIQKMESLGIQVLICKGKHHRKLAIIDRQILWEGSLNILSQLKSREIMRRFEEKEQAEECFDFLNFGRFIS